MPRPTVAEINLEAIAHNVRAVKSRVGPDVRVLAMVKADGYGHGAVPAAEAALRHGAEYLGVALVEEAEELRRGGIRAPILVFTGLGAEDVPLVFKWHITPVLTGVEFAHMLDRRAGRLKKPVKVHVEVDTGMGRLGFLPDEIIDVVTEVASMKNLLFEGLMTHFPSSDEKDKTFTMGQISVLRGVVDELRARGISIPLIHTANSGAVIDVPESFFNMVRLGISLYGCYPSDETTRSIDLVPALALRTRIVNLKSVPAGSTISYGRTFVTQRPTLVAVVPVGYADGLSRKLSNAGKMIVHARTGEGIVCPIIGRVCMDLTMLDVTDVPDVKVGSEVTVYSARRGDPNSVEAVARLIGTIPNEVTCAVSKRVPRVYLPAQPPAGGISKSEYRNPKQ
jgi:alanine racemase